MRPSPEATAAVRRAVGAALVTEAGGRTLPVDLGGVGLDDLLAAVQRHRVTALLAAQGASIGLPPDVVKALVDARQRAQLGSLGHLRRLVEVGRVLEEAGVPVLFVKGPCLAMQTTGDFTSRDPGDVDILVDPASAAEALTALVDAGWEPVPGLPSDVSSWGWKYLQTVSYEVTLDGPLGAVDLHWRLDPTRRGLPGFAELWARRSKVAIVGRVFDTLSPEDALTHSCHHAAKDEWRNLRSLVDIHRMLRDLPPTDVLGRRVPRRTIVVVEATVGLPRHDEWPPVGRRRSDRTARRRALMAQDGPLRPEVGLGRGAYRTTRYRLASGRGFEDAVLTIVAAVLPPAAFEGISSRAPMRAIPQASWGRLRYVISCLGADVRLAAQRQNR